MLYMMRKKSKEYQKKKAQDLKGKENGTAELSDKSDVNEEDKEPLIKNVKRGSMFWKGEY